MKLKTTFTLNKGCVKLHAIFDHQSVLRSVILLRVFFYILSFDVQSFYVVSFDVLSFDVESFYVQSFDVQSFDIESFYVESFDVQSFDVQSFDVQ
jgi:hypothetical protein